MKHALLFSAGRISQVRISHDALPTTLQQHLKGGKKQPLSEWSTQSRRNMVRNFLACEWGSVEGEPVMITLTYATSQLDGRACRQHLSTFRRAWTHKWGHPIGAWKLEFQRSGVPHWHLVLYVQTHLPSAGQNSTSTLWIDARGNTLTGWKYENAGPSQAHSWVQHTWQRIVGPETKIVDFDPWRGARDDWAWYFGGYARKKSKEYQNHAPDNSSGWGRRWGIWGIRPQWQVAKISVRQGYRVRRVLRGLQNAKRRKWRHRKSNWYVHDSPSARIRVLETLKTLE